MILHNLSIQHGDNGDDLPDCPPQAYHYPRAGNRQQDNIGDQRPDYQLRRNELLTFFQRN